MKKWLYAAALIALGLLTRLPHPARDIAKLEPVQLVYIYKEAGSLCIETDTDHRGTGRDLSEAAADLRSKADGEIFLETAEFLLLDPDVTVAADFFTLLRPGAGVVYTGERPDLTAAAEYLSIHPPEHTLRELRKYLPQGERGRP